MVFTGKSIFNWDNWRINQLPSGKLTIGELENGPFIVDLLIKNVDFPSFFACFPEGNGNNYANEGLWLIIVKVNGIMVDYAMVDTWIILRVN